MAINWDVASLGPANPRSFSLLSNFSPSGVTSFPISAAGGISLTGTAGSPVSGTSRRSPIQTRAIPPSDLSATINWGDGSYVVGHDHGRERQLQRRRQPHVRHRRLVHDHGTVSRVSNGQGAPSLTDSAVITSTPTSGATGLGTVGITAAGFSGSVVARRACRRQHPSSTGSIRNTPVAVRSCTPTRPRPSRWARTSRATPVSASVSRLVPNALYHVRLVATNSAGTTFGPDATFTTQGGAAAEAAADPGADVQHRARERRRPGQDQRCVRAA